MVTKEIDKKSFVSTDENGKLIITNKEGNKMVGIAYISGKDATVVLNRLEKWVADKKHLDSFWEDVLIEDNHYLVDANLVDEEDVFEISTEPDDLGVVRDALEAKGYAFLSAEVAEVPSTTVDLTDEEAIEKMTKLLEMLEDDDDVQEVYHNWNMPEEEDED